MCVCVCVLEGKEEVGRGESVHALYAKLLWMERGRDSINYRSS